jgi:hypothetical protein
MAGSTRTSSQRGLRPHASVKRGELGSVIQNQAADESTGHVASVQKVPASLNHSSAHWNPSPPHFTGRKALYPLPLGDDRPVTGPRCLNVHRHFYSFKGCVVGRWARAERRGTAMPTQATESCCRLRSRAPGLPRLQRTEGTSRLGSLDYVESYLRAWLLPSQRIHSGMPPSWVKKRAVAEASTGRSEKRPT